MAKAAVKTKTTTTVNSQQVNNSNLAPSACVDTNGQTSSYCAAATTCNVDGGDQPTALNFWSRLCLCVKGCERAVYLLYCLCAYL